MSYESPTVTMAKCDAEGARKHAEEAKRRAADAETDRHYLCAAVAALSVSGKYRDGMRIEPEELAEYATLLRHWMGKAR